MEIRLARVSDSKHIAMMSRDLIEVGLGWSWTPTAVSNQIKSRDTIVVLARIRQRLAGFAIMYFLEEDAHLYLLGVKPAYQRQGIGCRLVEWLEESARIAGIAEIHLEVRLSNQSARDFYRTLGYQEVALLPRYYRGREAAVRMRRKLRQVRWSEFSHGFPEQGLAAGFIEFPFNRKLT